MTTQSTYLFWFGIIAAFFGLVWLFNDVITPFILGMAIAYLLNPVVLRLERRNMPRWLGVLIILVLFLGLTAFGLVLLVPVLAREMAQLYSELPTLLSAGQRFAVDTLGSLGVEMNADPSYMVDQVQSNAGNIFSVGRNILASLMAGGMAVISFVAFLFLMPIVAFYMMVDWPRLVSKLDDLLPRGHAGKIRTILSDIDRSLAGFVRGQLTVCFILGMFYGLALSIVGLKYGFVIGVTAGVLTIIPFVGAAIGLVLSVAVAWFTSGDLTLVFASLIVFGIGQVLEGNYLTPKLVGDNVGLHPLWIVFALMAGGALLGFVGMLIAVPVAAIIGVMVRFALSEYKSSKYYSG